MGARLAVGDCRSEPVCAEAEFRSLGLGWVCGFNVLDWPRVQELSYSICSCQTNRSFTQALQNLMREFEYVLRTWVECVSRVWIPIRMSFLRQHVLQKFFFKGLK